MFGVVQVSPVTLFNMFCKTPPPTLPWFANCPFIFNIFIINIKLLYFTFIPYVWYCIALIIALKHILKCENYLKPAIISLAPQALLLIYFLSQIFQTNNGVAS